jgi:hypothetical protein
MIRSNLFTPALVLSVVVTWGCSDTYGASPPGAAQITGVTPAREVRVTAGPVVRSVTDTTAVIAWSTNVIADSLLRYGKGADNLDQLARSPWNGLTHSVQLRNLTAETTYYYRVGTSATQSTEPMRSVASFKTNAARGGP